MLEPYSSFFPAVFGKTKVVVQLVTTLNEIHGYIQNFMLYKMIYFSTHKFAFSNLRFSPFYEHFRQLREKYVLKLKIKYIMLISSLSPI